MDSAIQSTVKILCPAGLFSGSTRLSSWSGSPRLEVLDWVGKAIWFSSQSLEGGDEVSDRHRFLMPLRPTDHPEGPRFSEPIASDCVEVMVGGHEDSSLLGGIGEKHIIRRAGVEDIDRPDDVPALPPQRFDERSFDVLVCEEWEASCHYLAGPEPGSRIVSCSAFAFSSLRRSASISSLWS